uniref:Capping protein inhibiting regulator of actin dynamics n=1 Tax=Mustela putorius furo TaxID=9669 RepID=M3Y0X3_MUSPF
MGTRAFSHDSIFIPDGGAESEQTVQAMSQDNILGKVKTLQRQLSKNIKFGRPPPSAIPMKKADSGEAGLEEDLLLTSPMEIVTHEDVPLSDTENKPSDPPSSQSPLNLPGARSEMEDKVAPVKPSRPKRHLSSAGTIESVNLDAIPLAIARLDNSAAKHKLSVKPKNQRVSKKHRRLARDGPHEHGGLLYQLSPDQNGHSGEDKPVWHEEEPELLDSEEEKRCQEEYWLELEAKCKRQKAEAAERKRLEEQRLQALERRLWEENRRQELLEEKGEDEEGERAELQLEAEERQRQEEKEQRAREEQQLEEEQQRRREEQLRLEEEQRRLEEEQQRRLEEEQRQREEEQRQLEEELRRREEEEEQRERVEKPWLEAEAAARRRAELGKREQVEALRRPEGERREAARGHEEKWQQLDEKRGLRSPKMDFAEKPRKREHPQPEKQSESSEESKICEKQSQEAVPAGEQPGQHGDGPEPDRRARREERPGTSAQPPQKQEAQVEVTPGEKKEATAPEKDRKGEELRWQEVDERQSMPRPYTFQVSSGGKQILFPKVNLSPVTPARGAGLASAPHAPKTPRAGAASHALPSSLSVPHTAILVTGAQLCGPAVNLSQIKDTACKSLLGLSEEKKHVDVPALENPPRAPVDPRAGSGKVRAAQESPSSAAALAEWASIRSRILKNAEGEQPRPSDEHPPRARSDSRGNLRRTPPVNAKFSIMPAWQKFSDGGTETSKQNTEAESTRKRPSLGPGVPQPLDTNELPKGAEKPEPADTTEGCKFAKDLPSFLVPSPAYPPQKAVAHAEPGATSDAETSSGRGKPDPSMPSQEEKASPFGIKLRRTNYSLRFHCDQQTEQKKKKRHSSTGGSTGDSADGGAPAPGGTRGEKEPPPRGPVRGWSPQVPRRRLCPLGSGCSVARGASGCTGRSPAVWAKRVAAGPPRPGSLALGPSLGQQVDPAVSRPFLPHLFVLLMRSPVSVFSLTSQCAKSKGVRRHRSPILPSSAEGKEGDVSQKPNRQPHQASVQSSFQERPLSISFSFSAEKPVLQSRHSLDGSKVAEKADTAQPLWITLALQKQKGFREQQATREEKKQAREAKQAEQLSRENVGGGLQPGGGSGGRAGSPHKARAPPEEKQPETAASRLERREQLKKANTLPTSVTERNPVEISDSAPPAPLVKEVTKRFSTPDAAPVSTEPAWLALAKRKAKAWSDCPQIIK